MDIEQIAAICPQGVADVAERGAVRQDRLPVGASARDERPTDLRTDEGSAGQRHDAAVSLHDVAEIEQLSQSGVEAIDRGQAGVEQLKHAGPRAPRGAA